MTERDMADPSTTPEALAEMARERLGEKLEEAQEQLERVNERAQSFIRKHPGASLLGAAALGYLIGKLVRR